jgi:amino acid transporter
VSLVKPPSAPPEATTDAGEVRLARGVTLLDATLLGTGALLGGGVFVLLGLAAGLAGPAVLLALFLNGLITIPTLLVYAELGSASGEAGGGYRWIREGLGRQFGFFGGWLAWFSHAAACALYALAAAAFAAFIARSAGWLTPTPEAVQGLALALAGLFVALSYGGVKLGFRAQNAANLLVLVAVLVFVGFGIGEVLENPDRVRFNLDPFFPGGSTWSGLSGVLLAMGLTFIAFQGYELVAQTSEEIQDPRRNIPRAIWASFLAAWGLMLAVAFVALAGTSFVQGEQSWVYLAGARESALVEAAGRLMPAGAIAIAGAALLLQLTALNACLYSSSRVSFAMGRDGDLPRTPLPALGAARLRRPRPGHGAAAAGHRRLHGRPPVPAAVPPRQRGVHQAAQDGARRPLRLPRAAVPGHPAARHRRQSVPCRLPVARLARGLAHRRRLDGPRRRRLHHLGTAPPGQGARGRTTSRLRRASPGP